MYVLRLVLVCTFGFAFNSHAEILNEERLFIRCFAHLTNSRPSDEFSRALLADVQAGRIGAVDACMRVLEASRIDPNTGLLVNYSDARASTTARATLKTLNDFHRSWFSNDAYNSMGLRGADEAIALTVDRNEPALFITRAALRPNTSYSSVVTSDDSLQALREVGGTINTAVEIRNGPLVGIRPYPKTDGSGTPLFNVYAIKNAPWATNPSAPPEVKSIANAPRSFGGGIIGTQSYLLLNAGNMDANSHSDGGYRLYRRWSKNLFKDLMCRPVPVLTPELGSRYAQEYQKYQNRRELYQLEGKKCVDPVKNELLAAPATPLYASQYEGLGIGWNYFPALSFSGSAIPFRSSGSCMSCHATLDSMATTIRSLFSRNLSDGVLRTQVVLFKRHDQNVSIPDIERVLRYSRTAPFEYENMYGHLDLDQMECRLGLGDCSNNPLMQRCVQQADTTDVDQSSMGGLPAKIFDATSNNSKVGARTYRYQPMSYAVDINAVNFSQQNKFTFSEPDGMLNFISYDGQHIEKEILAASVPSVSDVATAGLVGLGREIAETPDLYVCAASRYFEFFTGIKVSISPDLVLNPEDKKLRDEVVKLGLELRKDQQDLKKIIRMILSSEIYRESSLRDRVKEAGN